MAKTSIGITASEAQIRRRDIDSERYHVMISLCFKDNIIAVTPTVSVNIITRLAAKGVITLAAIEGIIARTAIETIRTEATDKIIVALMT